MQIDVNRLEEIIRENERMKTALENIKDYAAQAVIGGWRQIVFEMTKRGLGLK